SVIPLPKLAVYGNLYLLFKVAGVLDVQFGVDCDYYTRYKSVQYQPSTMTFYNQTAQLCGNYPFMNLYANMKLSKARFYVMMTHINQGMTGSNYFSMPSYPLNPRRLQFGISVDFAN
ncbi:MAG: putative porin, partial [Muribaculaceae bacterium]|nr:putative porin [Muribaculaceae bacterium]